MGANEKLGISIEINEVTVAGDLAGKISSKVQDLGKDVKPVKVGVETGDLSGITKQIESLVKVITEGFSGKATDSTQKLTSRIKAMAEAFKISEDQAKALVKATGDSATFEKMAKSFEKIKLETNKTALAEKAYADALAKTGEAAAKKSAVLTTAQTRDLELSKQRGVQLELEQKREIELANLRGKAYAEAERQRKATLDSQIGLGSATMSSYRNSGFQQVNGGYVRSSVNTSLGMDEAHAAALKMNAAMVQLNPKIKEYEEYMKALHTRGQAMWNGQIVSTQQYSRNLREMNGEIKSTVKAFDFLGKTLGSMAARMAEFYSIRTIMFTLGSQFRESTAAALDFNQATHDIIAISGESKDGIGAVGNAIWDIAKASRYSAKEVADLLQVLAQAGVKSENLPGVANSVGKFATGAGADPRLAADLFTTSMNVFNISADSSMRITNALTAALNNSKLEANGLATAFNYLAPQAAQLGISMESTLGIISTMAQSGIKASTIGTGVSQMLKEFAAPKGRLKNLLEYYGLTPENINPLKHSFADIVDSLNNAKGKAGETGVAVQHLFSALESRVGRSAIAAINLGGDAFRNMENSITGTSAALIAYDKSMEGARARLNVIQQTFHSFISGTLDNLAPLFVGAMNSLRGFLTVFDTEGGKAIAAGTAIAAVIGSIALAASALKAALTASAALKGGGFLANLLGGGSLAALIANPVALTAILVGVGVAIVGLGSILDRNKQIEEDATKATLKNIEAKQGYVSVLQGIKTSMEAQNNGLREYADLLLLEGKESTKVKKLGETLVVLKDDQRKALSNYIAKFPDLFKGMDTEITKYEQLIGVINKYNSAKFGDATSAGDKYNRILHEAAIQYKKDIGEIDNSGSIYETQEQRKQGAKEKFNARLNEKDATDLRDSATNGSVSKNVVVVDPKTGKNKIRTDTTNIFPGAETVVDSGLSIRYLTTKTTRGVDDKVVGEFDPSAKPKAKPKGIREQKGESFDSYYYKENEKLVQAKLHADIASDKVIVSNKEETEERRTAALLRVVEANEQIFESEVKASQEKHREKLVNSPATSSIETRRNQALLLKLQAADVLAAKAKMDKDNESTLRGFDKEKKDPADTKPNTIGRVKAADIELGTQSKILSIQKERAWVAAEVDKLSQQQTENEIANSVTKKKIYEEEEVYLKNQLITFAKDESKLKEINNQLESNKEAHRVTVDLLEEQRKKLQEIKDANPYSNFLSGVQAATRSLTDMNAMSRNLGSSITNTAVNGVTDTAFNVFGYSQQKADQKQSITDEVTKLTIQKNELVDSITSATQGGFMTPEQATQVANQKVALTEVNSALDKQKKALGELSGSWSNFAKGLKKVMVSILEEIQKYIIKMFAAYLVQKLVGLVGGAMGSTVEASGFSAGGAPMLSNGSQVFANGGYVQKLANGGGVLNGTFGGLLPLNGGYAAGKDSVPIMGMPGEYMIKKSSVDFYGRDFFEKANAQKLAAGGLIGATKSTSQPTNSEKPYEIHIFNIADPTSIPKQSPDANEIINIISFDAAKRGTMHKVIRGVMAG